MLQKHNQPNKQSELNIFLCRERERERERERDRQTDRQTDGERERGRDIYQSKND